MSSGAAELDCEPQMTTRVAETLEYRYGRHVLRQDEVHPGLLLVVEPHSYLVRPDPRERAVRPGVVEAHELLMGVVPDRDADDPCSPVRESDDGQVTLGGYLFAGPSDGYCCCLAHCKPPSFVSVLTSDNRMIVAVIFSPSNAGTERVIAYSGLGRLFSPGGR